MSDVQAAHQLTFQEQISWLRQNRAFSWQTFDLHENSPKHNEIIFSFSPS
jgi:hypothetical protein